MLLVTLTGAGATIQYQQRTLAQCQDRTEIYANNNDSSDLVDVDTESTDYNYVITIRKASGNIYVGTVVELDDEDDRLPRETILE